MPVPIQFKGTSKDTTIVFNHTFSGQTFTTTVNFPINSIVFDPEYWLISGNNTIVNVAEYSKENIHLNIFPNPVHNNLVIGNFKNEMEVLKIQILDVFGRVIFKEINPSQNNHSININTENIPNGIYIIEITSNVGKNSLKFLKQ